MKLREFAVWETKQAGELVGLKVTDWDDNDKTERTPGHRCYRQPAAEFPIGGTWTRQEQNDRAQKFCDYLNSIVAAQNRAVADDALLQRIMLPYEPKDKDDA